LSAKRITAVGRSIEAGRNLQRTALASRQKVVFVSNREKAQQTDQTSS